jgi:hypothetical protein
MYYPRKMLLTFAQAYPDETRQALRALLDGEKRISERIDQSFEIFERMRERRNKEAGVAEQSSIRLRFLSLFLGYAFPNEANAVKPTEWRTFCQFLDASFRVPMYASQGQLYEHYEPYIEALRTYLKTLPEIRNLRDELTRGLSFRDAEYRWMAQDVIYVGAWVRGHKRAGEPVSIVPEPIEESEDAAEAVSALRDSRSGIRNAVPAGSIPRESDRQELEPNRLLQ